ncbi:hypothetical protein [Actinopolymorpha pittospori]|uniref:Uncharacterized protein n=1 Tax=Actinopolymorpha pittospori TaxID=648752 RepID=A0A927N499_9ACTN|nr:hypothetical protein [Actinopolymorpha pittospori]MBE1608682.1 hypothetical protein [Actinopolymorpha pittospori]
MLVDQSQHGVVDLDSDDGVPIAEPNLDTLSNDPDLAQLGSPR